MKLKFEAQLNKVFDAIRSRLKKEGLYVSDTFVIQRPYIICSEFVFLILYYMISLLLLWVDTISFWSLILNSCCLVRAAIKTILKNNKYTSNLQLISNQDHLNEQTKFFLQNNCTAYIRAQRRETVCVIIMFVTAIVIAGLKNAWVAPCMRVASSCALVVVAIDDFLSDAEEFYDAHPPIPDI